mgnify:CR=1 FL=1
MFFVTEGKTTENDEVIPTKRFKSLEYANSSDTQNGGKTLAVDCTQTANTEFYIDLGKEYDVYTGAGFSDKTPENFYKKSAVEFRIKLNDTHRGLRQYDSVIPDYSRLKIPRRGTEKNYTKKPGSFYASG